MGEAEDRPPDSSDRGAEPDERRSADETPDPGKHAADTLRLDYEQTVGVIKMLTDVRFKLLALVPTVSAIGVVVADKRTRADAIGIALIGLIATTGILIYDLRNSQLYGAAIHRAKEIEKRLRLRRSNPGDSTVLGGLFAERSWRLRLAGVAIWHDRALAFVYAAAITGWTYVLAAAVYPIIEQCVSNGFDDCLSEQSLATPVTSTPTPWALLIAAAAGLFTGVLVHAFDRRGDGTIWVSSGVDPAKVEPELVLTHANNPQYAGTEPRPRQPRPLTVAQLLLLAVVIIAGSRRP
jgi:hypothetical protein